MCQGPRHTGCFEVISELFCNKQVSLRRPSCLKAWADSQEEGQKREGGAPSKQDTAVGARGQRALRMSSQVKTDT